MGAESGDAEEEEVAAPVLVGSAVTGPIAATVSSASTIEAERQVTVAAEATGQVTALGVEEGDTVEASDVFRVSGLADGSITVDGDRVTLQEITPLLRSRNAERRARGEAELIAVVETHDNAL